MREKGTLTRAAFVGVKEEATRSGGTTAEAEKRYQSGGGLDPLVDPSGGGIYGPVRLSLPRLVEVEEKWQLVMGPPMLIETLLDTTGSMGGNVDRAFEALPHVYDMLKSTALSNYDIQIINAIFGDRQDRIILCRSQAEMAEKIAKQLTMMVPERSGHDNPEDPEYGLFGAAYLTKARIQEWGLKSYHFTLSDAPGRGSITMANLKRVFGEDVMEKVGENGHQIGNKLHSTQQIVSDLLKISHAFFLQVRSDEDTESFWSRAYSPDRIIKLPHMDLLPQVQAAVIGLTEGTLTLTGVKKFLMKEGSLNKSDADVVARAVSHIPVGAQTQLPNFDKLPQKGDMFRAKTDLWPIGHEFDKFDKSKEKPSENKKPVGWL